MSPRPTTRSAAALLALTFTLPIAAQQTVNIVADRDNTLWNSANGSSSNGAGDAFIVGRAGLNTAEPIRRGLVRFPIDSAVPAGAIVTGARMVLFCSRTHPSQPNVTISAHRASQNWGEGTSVSIGNQGQSAPATPGDATWLHTFWPNQNWANAGGDFIAQPSAQTDVQGTDYYTWSGPTFTADVQAFLDDPSQNFGWLLKAPEIASFTAKRFNSREYPVPIQHPRIEVDFVLPAAATPFGSGCSSSAGTTMQLGATGLPALGNNAFALTVSGGTPNTAVALFLSETAGTSPIGSTSCNFLLDLAGVSALAALGIGGVSLPAFDQSGRSNLPLPIPSDPSLSGLRLELQSIALDPPANSAGLVSSNGLTLRLR